MLLEAFGMVSLELKKERVSRQRAGATHCYNQKLLGGFGVLSRGSWNKVRLRVPLLVKKDR